jgi:hypothetical protein
MVESKLGEVFQFSIPAASILIEVIGGEEPAINDAYTGDTSCLY